STVRLALRRLRRSPGFGAAAVALLALGIGANAAVYALVDALLLAPLPGLVEPDRLVALKVVRQEAPGVLRPLTWGHYRDLDRELGIFSGVAAYAAIEVNLTREGPSEHLEALLVSDDYFAVLGVTPYAGRLFQPGDDPTVPRVVLSYGLWQRRFGGEPSAVGRDVVLNGVAHRIAGVTGPSFTGTDRLEPPALFLLLNDYPQVARGIYATFQGARDRKQHWLEGVARLAEGVTLDRAQAALRQLGEQLAAAHPEHPRGRTFALLPLGQLAFGVGQRHAVVRWAALLVAASTGILLIACANLAVLLLARSLDRRREIAIRSSLGAGWRRLVVSMLGENLLLALIGGVVGVAGAHLALPLLERLELPVAVAPFTLELQPRIAGAALLAAVLTAALAGLPSAAGAARTTVASALRSAPTTPFAGGGIAAQHLLAAIQVALAVMILIAASLFVRTLRNLETVPLGFDPSRVLIASLDLSGAPYQGERLNDVYRQLTARLERLNDVEAVGLAAALPIVGARMTVDLTVGVEGGAAAGEPPTARHALVGADFFRLLGLKPRLGRLFGPADDAGAPPVVVINRTLAERCWPGQNPIGRRLHLYQTEEPFTVAGVVPDTVFARRREGVVPLLYLALAQHQRSFIGPMLAPQMTLLLRTRDAAGDVAPQLRRVVAELDPDLPLFAVMPLEQRLYGALGVERQAAMVFSLFAAIALALTLLGLHGVLARMLIARRGEIGVRLALGASPGSVARRMLLTLLRPCFLGIALGLAATWPLGRLVESRLYGVAAADPLTACAAALAVLATVVASGWPPAIGAARTSPAAILHQQ
ncbi:MAG: FtsX-like permease family protein, partial [Acidobacteria bacterium]